MRKSIFKLFIIACIGILYACKDAFLPEKASPFTAVEWENDLLRVKFEGEWYWFQKLDHLSKEEILAFCKKEYAEEKTGSKHLWKKRFSEDLVEVLKKMGHTPNTEVALLLAKDSVSSGLLEKIGKEYMGMLTGENRVVVRDYYNDYINGKTDKLWSLAQKDSISKVKMDKYRKSRIEERIAKGLVKGKLAPYFVAETIEGKEVAVSDFKGKYIVIDVWATWCGPCKKDRPYFEKLAQKYNSGSVQFVSISIDKPKDKETWIAMTKGMSGPVLQLYSVDRKKFNESYDIRPIPRYMIIGPEGNIVNIDLFSSPRKPGFEDLLRDGLGLAYK